MDVLSNEEIAKVFAMYMPCDTVQDGNNFNRRLVSVGGFEDGGYAYGKLKNKASTATQFISNFKLKLTPLSAITDEGAIAVANIAGWEHSCLVEGKRIANDLAKEDETTIYSIQNGMLVFQYLVQKHYAVPLFFGIDHWANNKTAIELGIAIVKN